MEDINSKVKVEEFMDQFYEKVNSSEIKSRLQSSEISFLSLENDIMR